MHFLEFSFILLMFFVNVWVFFRNEKCLVFWGDLFAAS